MKICWRYELITTYVVEDDPEQFAGRLGTFDELAGPEGYELLAGLDAGDCRTAVVGALVFFGDVGSRHTADLSYAFQRLVDGWQVFEYGSAGPEFEWRHGTARDCAGALVAALASFNPEEGQ